MSRASRNEVDTVLSHTARNLAVPVESLTRICGWLATTDDTTALDGVTLDLQHWSSGYRWKESVRNLLHDALLRNKHLSTELLDELAMHLPVVTRFHREICTHPGCSDMVLVELGWTLRSSLLPVAEAYESMEGRNPGLTRALRILDAVPARSCHTYRETARMLAPLSEEELEVFIVLSREAGHLPATELVEAACTVLAPKV